MDVCLDCTRMPLFNGDFSVYYPSLWNTRSLRLCDQTCRSRVWLSKLNKNDSWHCQPLSAVHLLNTTPAKHHRASFHMLPWWSIPGLYQVRMNLKIHVNLIIFFFTETINKVMSWHPFELAFKIALNNSKRFCHHFHWDEFIDGSSPRHLHIVQSLPQSSELPAPMWFERWRNTGMSLGHLR